MARADVLEPVDTRLALKTYGTVVGLGGFVLAAWGQLWLGSHLPEAARDRVALIPLSGSVMIAAAVMAFGLARGDARTRRRMLTWFIAGHVVVWAMLQLQLLTTLSHGGFARHASGAVLMAIFGLLYVRFPSTPRTRPALSVVRGPDLHDSTKASEGLSEQQIRDAAAQEERNRLARDLHDAVKQQIFSIQTSAATAEARFDTDTAGARDALVQIRQSAREAMGEMQAMLEQLRVAPLGRTGLVEAIRKQCDALAFRTGATVDVQVTQLPSDDALEPGAHQAIFRIVQEALANVGRHARARHVRVSLDATPTRFEVTVQDDGRGFDPTTAPGGMGLHNMRARASEIGGTIEVVSTGGAGTLVTLSILLETAEVRQYLRRQALGLAVLLGVATALLVLDLIENGLRLGSAPMIIFPFLLMRHLRTWRRLRPSGDAPSPSPPERP